MERRTYKLNGVQQWTIRIGYIKKQARRVSVIPAKGNAQLKLRLKSFVPLILDRCVDL